MKNCIAIQFLYYREEGLRAEIVLQCTGLYCNRVTVRLGIVLQESNYIAIEATWLLKKLYRNTV